MVIFSKLLVDMNRVLFISLLIFVLVNSIMKYDGKGITICHM